MAGERVQKMDVKKNRLSASSRADGRKAITFVSEVRQELKRVEWTSKDEIKGYTKIVLASTLVFAMFVYFTDLIIQGVLGLINLIVKFFI